MISTTTNFPSNRCRRQWSNSAAVAATLVLAMLVLPMVLGIDLLGGGMLQGAWHQITSEAAAGFDQVFEACYGLRPF